MDPMSEPPSIDETLREVARTRSIASALLHGAAAVEIDDVLQEASIAAMATGAPRGAGFAGWIRGAVHHLSLTVLRRRRSRTTREREAARPVALPSAADVAHRLALQRVLLTEVEALAEPIRSAIVRRYLDDVPPRVIAMELGVPLATVKTRLRRGLAQLREKLSREWGEELGAALLVLSRVTGSSATAVGAVAATTSATCAEGAGVVAMTVKAKVVAAFVALAIVGAAAIEVVRSSRHAGSKDSRASASEAASGGPLAGAIPDVEKPAATRLEDAKDEAPPSSGSRRARLGARRVSALVGRVIDEKGSAVAGAEIEVARPEYGRPAPIESGEVIPGERHRTTSAPDGTFRFDDLLRGMDHDVRARAGGGRRGIVRGVTVGSPLAITLTVKPTTAIDGVVVDARDGRAVAGATVRLDGAIEFEGLHGFDRITDEQGRFTMEEVDDSFSFLQVVAPDGRFSGGRTHDFTPGGRVEVRIPVGGLGVSGGVVVDAETGAPIPDAAILDGEFRDLIVARSDEDGRFLLRPSYLFSRDGSFDVSVVAAGFAEGRARLPGSEDPEAPLHEVEIRLQRERIAIGRIVLRDGSPLAGAALLAVVDDSKASHPIRITATGADGAFRIEALDPAFRHSLWIRHDECEQITVRFPPDETITAEVDLGTIQVGRGALLAGRVVDGAGVPIPESMVKLIGGVGESPSHRCDGEGRFEFAGVPAGRTKLYAYAKERLNEASAEIDVADEAILDDIVLTLPSGAVITGSVVDSKGALVKGALVVLMRRAEGSGREATAATQVASDAEGRFRCDGLDANATYAIAIQPSWNVALLVRVHDLDAVRAGASDLRLLQPDSESLSGHVVDADGKPIGDAHLRLLDRDGIQLTALRSRRDGSFEVSVPAGLELRLEARVKDASHPAAVDDDAPVAATLEHVHGGDPSVTLVVGKR
jgi:RNA polymerase sigma factor (sigma-70 family)